MSLLPAHQPGKGEADDDERTAGGLRADDPRSDDGLGTERPRYAFAYAPADDDLDDDDDNDDNDLDDDVTDDAADDNAAGSAYQTVGGTAADDDLAGRYRDDDPAVTGIRDVPGGSAPTVEVPADDSAPAYPVTADPAATAEVPAAELFPAGTPAAEAAVTPAASAVPVFTPRAAAEREPAVAAAAMASPGLDDPLLAAADATGLRTRWQRAQSGFVDDPRAAVAEAAALVEQTAKAIADAVEQRQRQLRAQWEYGQANGSAAGSVEPGTGDPADTERLRLTMRSYRALFNQLCVP